MMDNGPLNEEEAILATLKPSVYALLYPNVFTYNEHAMAEFIDNSIQACKDSAKPEIDIHFFSNKVYATSQHETGYLMIADNGCGMTFEDMKNFATDSNFLEIDKRFEKNTDRNSHFLRFCGVDAKNAAFHLSDRMIVITKTRGDPHFRRVILDRYEMLRRANAGENPFEYRFETNVPQRTLLPEDDNVLAIPLLQEKMQEHIAKNASNFTMIILKLKSSDTNKQSNEHTHTRRNAKVCQTLYDNVHSTVRILGEIYFFHLHPSPNYGQTDRRYIVGKNFSNKNIGIQLSYHVHYRPEARSVKPSHSFCINEEPHFLQDCFEKAKGIFNFKIEVPDPDSNSNELVHSITCMVLYFPNEQGSTSRSSLARHTAQDSNVETSIQNNQTIMQAYWQNRLTPQTEIESFPFLNIVKGLGENYKFPDCGSICTNWRNRLVGLLFFDGRFQHISSNKLYINVARGLQSWLNDLHQTENKVGAERSIQYTVNMEGGRLKILDGFKKWFATCFKAFDQELTFQKRMDNFQTAENKSCFKELQFTDTTGNVITLSNNSMMKWQTMTNGPFIYGKVVDFMVNQALIMGQDSYSGQGIVRYIRQPEILFGKGTISEISANHICKLSKKLENIREADKLIRTSVTQVKVFAFDAIGAQPREVPKEGFKISTNATFHKFGVQLFNDQSTAVPIHEYEVPNDVPGVNKHLRPRSFNVQLLLTDPKGVAITYDVTSKLEIHDAENKVDIYTKPEHVKNTPQLCFFVPLGSGDSKNNQVSFPTSGRYIFRILVRCGSVSIDTETIRDELFVMEVNYPEIRGADAVLPSSTPLRLGQYLPPFDVRLHFQMQQSNTTQRTETAVFSDGIAEPIPSILVQRREALQNEWRASELLVKKKQEWMDGDRELGQYAIDLEAQIEQEKAIVMIETSKSSVMEEDGVRIVAGKMIQKKRKPDELNTTESSSSSSYNSTGHDAKRPRM